MLDFLEIVSEFKLIIFLLSNFNLGIDWTLQALF